MVDVVSVELMNSVHLLTILAFWWHYRQSCVT